MLLDLIQSSSPYQLLAIAFTVMAVIALVLAIVAGNKSARVAVVGGFAAAVFALASAVLIGHFVPPT